MPIQISLLGGQSVSELPSGAVTTRSARTIALVAYLAVHSGAPQSRHHIAGLFWPDSTEAQALTNLRRELHFLRRALATEPSLLVTAKDLQWRDVENVVVDVRIFDVESSAALAAQKEGDPDAALARAEAALAQYRGDLLPGLYDDWVLDARADLQRRCTELYALVGELRSERGDHPGALEAARQRIRLQPLEEIGYRVLIELQADQGDRAGAISTYHRCASLLERELGIRPSPVTRAALQRVMAEAPAAKRADRAAIERPGRAQAELVGRARELRLLRDLWRDTGTGRPALAVVRGGAGVGKTRLIEDVAETARQGGGLVAGSQCFGTSGRLALAPVADWLRSPAVQPGTAALDPVWREEVQRLVPSPEARAGPLPAAPVAPAGTDVWQGHRFLEGLARALVGAGRPTLLTLDNLQWCDQESLTFLTFLLKLMPEAPVLVLCTLRTNNSDDEPGLADWITRIRATGRLTEVTLHPLDASGTARLAEAIAGRPFPAGDHELLQAATGGFPLHIVEAMRAQTEQPRDPGLPTGDLTVVLRHRLEQVSPGARDVAGLAAAVGRDFTLDLLAEASDLDADDVVDAVDELWRARIVQEHGDGYDFSHDLVRDAAYAQVSPPRRWLLHRRLAQGLELVHADDLGPVTAQLAEQYARGGRPERAVAYYQRAATMATGIFAHAEAIRLYSAALSIVRAQPAGRDPERRELALLEAMAAPLNARYGYSSPRLQEVLERSIGLAEALGRTESTINGLVGLWACRWVQGMVADSHRIATRAVDLVGAGSEHRGAAHFALGGATVSLGRPAEALRHFEIAARLPRGALLSVGTRPEVHTPAFAAHAHWLLGHDELALSSAREAIDLARSLDHPYSLALALAYAGITHQMRADRVELMAAVTELRELCDRYGFGYYREWGLILEGWCRGGGAGIDLARRGIDNLKYDGSFARMPYWLALLAELLAATGRLEAARSTLDAAVASARARSDVWWLPEVERMRARYVNAAGLDADRLRVAADLAAEHGSVALLRRCRRDLAEAGLSAEGEERSAYH